MAHTTVEILALQSAPVLVCGTPGHSTFLNRTGRATTAVAKTGHGVKQLQR